MRVQSLAGLHGTGANAESGSTLLVLEHDSDKRRIRPLSSCSRDWAVILTCGWLAACATHKPAPPPVFTVAPPRPPAPLAPEPALAPPPAPRLAFAYLPGWNEDDHAAALAAFAASCFVARDSDMARVCRRARETGPLPEARARTFFEENFRLDPVPAPGLLTAYFTPIYEARTYPTDDFSAPMRPHPADLGAAPPPEGGYPDRAAIEARPADDALAWMRPEDLFFLQIQGSGVLTFPDGRRARAVFDGVNGARFVAIAAPMRRQGLLGADQTSGEAIRAWLAAHRGPDADAIMWLNPRYVFFRLVADDGREPAGAAGVPLKPGRAVAVDAGRHNMGDLVWIDATAPMLAGAFPSYRRLVVALDTGGAIKGDARADLYMGRGPAAGVEAGRVRHTLRLYRLTPLGRPDE